MALVSYSKRGFSGSPDSPKTKFVEHSALGNLVQKSRPQSIGRLEYIPQHPLSYQVEVSAFICGPF